MERNRNKYDEDGFFNDSQPLFCRVIIHLLVFLLYLIALKFEENSVKIFSLSWANKKRLIAKLQ